MAYHCVSTTLTEQQVKPDNKVLKKIHVVDVAWCLYYRMFVIHIFLRYIKLASAY